MTDCEIICDDDRIINKIYHLSDVHIRLENNRHSEYRKVFVKTYNSIKKDIGDKTDGLIVVTGDILHSKTNLKPECIDLVKDFFIRLAKLTDVIVILGNHDCNLNNKESMDGLQPIITKGFKTRNRIFLLNDDLIYQYNNILFGVTTIYANNVTKCKIDDKTKIKIGLYHGFVVGAYTDLGFSVKEKKGIYDIEDFDDYDYVLLGDVHRFQYLNEEKTIAYASSLIQQNYGENLENHGYIVWNLKTKKSKFMPIQNEYGYVTFNLGKEGLYNVPKKLPSIMRLKLMYEPNVGRIQLQDMEKKIREDYNIDELTINRITNDDKIDIDLKDKNNKTLALNSNNNVMKIISNYVDTNHDMDKDEKKLIMKKIDEILTEINFDYEHETKNISLIDLYFDNMYAYGENNHINFEKLNGIVGLIAPNHYGKSCLIDSILYGIFGKSSRGTKNDCLNINKQNMKIRTDVKVGNDKYSIRRTAEEGGKKRKNIIESVDVYKNDGVATKDDKKQTESYISNIICNQEDLTRMNILLQNDAELSNMTDVQRREMLFKFFKLDIFGSINKIAKSEYHKRTYSLSDIKKELVKYDEETLKTDISVDEINIEKLEKKIKDNEKEIEILIKKEGEYENKIGNLDNKNIGTLVKKAKQLEKDFNLNNKELQSKEKTIQILEKKVPKLEKEMLMSKKQLNSYKNIEEENIEFEKKKKDVIKKLQNELNELHKNIKNISDDVDMNEIETHINKQKELLGSTKKTITLAKKEIKEKEMLKKNIKITKNIIKNADKYVENNKLIETVNLKLEKQNDYLDEIKKQYNKLHNHEYNPKCKACLKNPLTEQKLYYEKEINSTEDSINELINEKNALEKDSNELIDSYNKKLEYDESSKTNEKIENELISLKDKLNVKNERVVIIEEKLIYLENKLNESKKNEDIKKENMVIENEIKIIKNKIHEEEEKEFVKYSNYLSDKEEHEDNYNLFREKETKLLKLRNENNELEIKNKEIKTELNNMKSIVEKYEQSKDLLDNLEEIKEQLYDKNKEKDKFKDKIKLLNENITNNKTSLSKLIDAKNKLELIETEKSLYGKITEIMGSTGLINNIFSEKIIPRLENYINDVLESITDFLIGMEYDGLTIRIYKVHGSKQINLSLMSGYEKFVVNVAFRMALADLNNNLKSDFFIIDEGFSYCDKNHLEKLKSLFEYLRKRFKWSLVISHLDEIKENFDQTLNIDIINGCSKIILE